jgi:hypothetical protein
LHVGALEARFDSRPASNLGKPYRHEGGVVKAEHLYERTARGCKDVETNHEAESVYPKEQMLIFEASNGMIDSHVGDQMQVHVPIFESLILHAFKRLGSDPQQYRGQSAILYSLTTLVWQWTSTTNKQKCHIG